MKERLVFLLLALTLCLHLFPSPGHAEAWPASRQELAAENLLEERGYWRDGEYHSPAKKWAELWARKNYGEDAIIFSTQRIDTGQSLCVNVEKLLDGYQWLETDAWEIQLTPQKLPDDLELSEGVLTVSVQVRYYSIASSHGVRLSSEEMLGNGGGIRHHVLCFKSANINKY